MDGGGFEPPKRDATDLQSAPFGHSGTHPKLLNGRLVVSDLDYMNYTRYMHIIPGIYQLTVYRRTNPGFAIVNTNIRLRSGYSYTLAVLGTFNDFSVQMLNA